MMNFNAEMIEKAKVAKTAEELLEIAKANGVEMTADEAATYFAQLGTKSGELDDDDLDAVAGGGCPLFGDNSCPECGGETKPVSRSTRECLTCGYQFS
jgi:predicted ribosomally synthesized peptide with nif11-like leader